MGSQRSDSKFKPVKDAYSEIQSAIGISFLIIFCSKIALGNKADYIAVRMVDVLMRNVLLNGVLSRLYHSTCPQLH